MSIFSRKTTINTHVDHVSAEDCFYLIDKPTRIMSHSTTLLDHFYSNIIDTNLTSTVLLYELPDHLPLARSIDFIPDPTNYNQKFYRDQPNSIKRTF